MKKKNLWHSLEIEEVFLKTNSSFEGLTEEEAQKRLKKNGPNTLPEESRFSAWRLLLSQFANPLMYIMIAATIVSFYLGKKVEGFFVLIVMISNALVGFYQERKANLSLSALKNLVKQSARVIRNHVEKEIDATELVRGDILILRVGDRVPADGRILQISGLKINEASLTGESKAVEKSLSIVSAKSEVADRTNMVFMGTMVEEGSATILVLETGVHTEYGDIISLLKNTEEEKTPLQESVIHLSKFIGIFITFLIAIIILEGYLKGQPLELIFETSLALFVSAIPEGLLPAITIILVLGMSRILKERGLVRRLAATETLGSVTVICTDKTGTLTEGKMEARSFLTTKGEHVVNTQSFNELKSETIKTIIKASALASDAYIENPGAPIEELLIRGSATEQALVLMAHKYGIEKHSFDQKETVIDTLFFSSDRKYSATLRNTLDGARLYAVGALEKMEHHITTVASENDIFDIKSETYKNLISLKDKMIESGYRVIACAYKDIKNGLEKNIEQLISEGMTLAGFIVISDPLRADVPSSFIKTQKAGIKTVVVTGDHKLTARAVALEMGLKINDDEIIEGFELEKISDIELQEKVKKILLYARVSPRHKLRIVQALQNNGEVVAMFGDGINDAPALKIADIGVAVGTKVAATREVADIVLLDGGFSTIIKAIEQGRLIFQNIRRIFLYLVTQDFSQFFIFIIAIILGLPLPLLATQLLLINLVESGLPDLALTTEQEKDGLMDEKPRGKKEQLLNRPSKGLMVSVFLINGAITLTFYILSLIFIEDIDYVRTMLMVLLCMESLFLVFSIRSFNKSIFRKDIFSNKLLSWACAISLVMILCAIYAEPLQKILKTKPLTWTSWVVILLINVIEIIIIDRLKLHLFKKSKFDK